MPVNKIVNCDKHSQKLQLIRSIASQYTHGGAQNNPPMSVCDGLTTKADIVSLLLLDN